MMANGKVSGTGEGVSALATMRAELPGHHAALFQLARSLVRDKTTAEDLVQETMERALLKAEQFRPGSNLKAWLMRILATRCSDRWRHERVRRSVRAEDVVLSVATLADDDQPSYQDLFCAEDVQRALGSLGRAQREMFVLRYLHGLSYKQIASRCGAKNGTIATRLSRARARLRQTMLASRSSVTPLPIRVVTSDAGRDAQPSRRQAAPPPRLAVLGAG